MKIGRKWAIVKSGMKICKESVRTCPKCGKFTAYEYAGTIYCDECDYRDNIFDRIQLH